MFSVTVAGLFSEEAVDQQFVVGQQLELSDLQKVTALFNRKRWGAKADPGFPAASMGLLCGSC